MNANLAVIYDNLDYLLWDGWRRANPAACANADDGDRGWRTGAAVRDFVSLRGVAVSWHRAAFAVSGGRKLFAVFR
ncbi:Uncharacterised protein [Kluyvera cryocrescens]|uniref:Uncharacterized protein n=1 Tax=Kluyvera cryocrescens TaxID=580 RepID=A0A485CDQ8_KLUCR|nr:Uncharacterised protein [Kluyvera cryocrescens]